MKPYEIRKYSEPFGVSIESAVRMRCRYLVQVCSQWENYINMTTDKIPESTVADIITEIDELRRFEKNHMKKTTGVITDEMIDCAREYPITSLIDFDRQGKALAWCHEDKSPSLTHWKKGNSARCFVCGLTYNSLDVLIKRDGMSFVEAVKQLCN